MGFGTTLFFFVYAAGVRVGELVSAMRFFYFLFVFLFWNYYWCDKIALV